MSGPGSYVPDENPDHPAQLVDVVTLVLSERDVAYLANVKPNVVRRLAAGQTVALDEDALARISTAYVLITRLMDYATKQDVQRWFRDSTAVNGSSPLRAIREHRLEETIERAVALIGGRQHDDAE